MQSLSVRAELFACWESPLIGEAPRRTSLHMAICRQGLESLELAGWVWHMRRRAGVQERLHQY